jgi:F-type H+-transporting ATPase subunit epsilon
VAETFLLEVVTPKNVVVSSQVEEMAAPGTEGEFGVLPGHTFFITLLSMGELSYSIDGKKEYLTVGEGFAEINLDRVTVIVDSAEYP